MTLKERVYEVAQNIPSGKVATYGQVAKLVGCSGAARFVGLCMRTNPYSPKVPCHRVVGADGRLVGFSAGEGLETKRQMLIDEGVMFCGDRVDLAKSQWNPRKS